MNMSNNYHLLLVHFPIALLSLYAFLEILSLSKYLRKKESLEVTKGILLVTGVVSGFLSETTGEETIEDMINRNDIHLRANARPSSNVCKYNGGHFSRLAISYIISFMENIPQVRNSKIYTLIRSKIPAFLLSFIFLFEKTAVRIILASAGFLSVMMTGGTRWHSCKQL